MSGPLLLQSLILGLLLGGLLRPAGRRPDALLRRDAGGDDRPLGVPHPGRLPGLVLPPRRPGLDPLLSLIVTVPLFFVAGVCDATAAAVPAAAGDADHDVGAADLRDRADDRGRCSATSSPAPSGGSSSTTPAAASSCSGRNIAVVKLIAFGLAAVVAPGAVPAAQEDPVRPGAARHHPAPGGGPAARHRHRPDRRLRLRARAGHRGDRRHGAGARLHDLPVAALALDRTADGDHRDRRARQHPRRRDRGDGARRDRRACCRCRWAPPGRRPSSTSPCSRPS